MELLHLFSKSLFVISVFSIILVFLFTPILIVLLSLFRRKKAIRSSSVRSSVSLIIITHNSGHQVVGKVKNSLSLFYPSDDYEIIVYSDGSTDSTADMIKPFINDKVLFYKSDVQEGKDNAINRAVQRSKGEFLVFSDVDSKLAKDAILCLTRWFADASVGGVCGRVSISDDAEQLTKAQSLYLHVDSLMKTMESNLGSISSKTGTISAIRRELFISLPPTVADDLYIPLSIIRQGYRFIYDPDAKAEMGTLFRVPSQEIRRRRRLVTRSLTAIHSMKEIMNPFQYGYYSVNLIINKILRRLLLPFLILLLFSSLVLSYQNSLIAVILVCQLFFYTLALLYWVWFQNTNSFGIVSRFSSMAFYFCLGNLGSFLGVLDFCRGKRIAKWESIRT